MARDVISTPANFRENCSKFLFQCGLGQFPVVGVGADRPPAILLAAIPEFDATGGGRVLMRASYCALAGCRRAISSRGTADKDKRPGGCTPSGHTRNSASAEKIRPRCEGKQTRLRSSYSEGRGRWVSNGVRLGPLIGVQKGPPGLA